MDKSVKSSNIYNFGPTGSHYEGHLKVYILTIVCMQQTNTNIIPWGILLFFLYWSYLLSVTPLAKL